MQLFGQGRGIDLLAQHPIDLGHLLAFKLDPTLLLQVVQRRRGALAFPWYPCHSASKSMVHQVRAWGAQAKTCSRNWRRSELKRARIACFSSTNLKRYSAK